jgi:hypothetical protein
MACRPAEDQWFASSVIQNIADTTLSTTQAPGSLDNEISSLLQEDTKAWREEDISNLRAHLDEEKLSFSWRSATLFARLGVSSSATLTNSRRGWASD